MLIITQEVKKYYIPANTDNLINYRKDGRARGVPGY
jgi:hypothetical protein